MGKGPMGVPLEPLGSATAPATSSAAATAATWCQPNVTLSSADYQQQWNQLAVCASVNLTCVGPPPEKKVIEDALMCENIRCMASGVQAGEVKFFLYAKKNNSTALFLMEMVVQKAAGAVYTTVK